MNNALMAGLLNRIERPMFWEDLRAVHDSVAVAVLTVGNSAKELMIHIRAAGHNALAEAVYATIANDFEQSIQEVETIFAQWSDRRGRIANDQEYAEQAKVFDMYRIAGERHQALFTPNLLELTTIVSEIVAARQAPNGDDVAARGTNLPVFQVDEAAYVQQTPTTIPTALAAGLTDPTATV